MDDIIRMAHEAGFSLYRDISAVDGSIAHLKHFATLVRADEREACAKVIEEAPCECCWPEGSMPITEDLAAAIRARGQA